MIFNWLRKKYKSADKPIDDLKKPRWKKREPTCWLSCPYLVLSESCIVSKRAALWYDQKCSVVWLDKKFKPEMLREEGQEELPHTRDIRDTDKCIEFKKRGKRGR